MKVRASIVILIILIATSCSPISNTYFNTHFKNEEKQFQHHTGLALYDLTSKNWIYQYNADKYFTPASNTKIFTLWGGLNILGDSIPGLEYIIRNDSMIFWGTGDPSFLNPVIHDNSRVYTFLKNKKEKLYFSDNNYNNPHFGLGWMWDDFHEDAPERSPLPIYGNTTSVTLNDSIEFTEWGIPFFDRHIKLDSNDYYTKKIARIVQNNQLEYLDAKPSIKFNLPFRYSKYLFTELLSDTLNKQVAYINFQKPENTQEIFSVPADSVYKIMMQESDNFIAEQLLLLCGNEILDTINSHKAITYITEKYLIDLPDRPIWKDGSGLSRYNLFTPRSIVALWGKIYNKIGQDRLFKLLAVGGESGTLTNYYKAETPYIYGKTGTLSNNHNLSGFIVTKSSKVLVFSYMNNNYPVSSRQIKPAMEQLLYEIHENY